MSLAALRTHSKSHHAFVLYHLIHLTAANFIGLISHCTAAGIMAADIDHRSFSWIELIRSDDEWHLTETSFIASFYSLL